MFDSQSAADPVPVNLSADRFERLQDPEVSTDGAAVVVEGKTAGTHVV
ncbi:hypothetical protein [Haloarchaeobius sp. DYHT-AS-18]